MSNWYDIPIDEIGPEQLFNHTIPTHPHPNTPRTAGGFRFPSGGPNAAARGSRWLAELINHHPYVAVFDLEPVADNHLYAVTPVDDLGRWWEFEIFDVLAPDVAPVYNQPGIYYRLSTHEQGKDSVIFHAWTRPAWEVTPEFPTPSESFRFGSDRHIPGIDWWTFTGPDIWTLPFGPGLQPDVWTRFHCLDLPWPLAPLAELSAEFNGIDARIDLSPAFAPDGTNYSWEGDFYYRSLTNGAWAFSSATDFSGIGMDATFVAMGGASGVHSSPPPLNQWVKIRVERDWIQTPLTHTHIFFDDVLQESLVIIPGGGSFDRIGGREAPTPAWGDYDLRNLKLLGGDPISPTVILDMPFTVNACDLGPGEHDGTTHNMALPSCP